MKCSYPLGQLTREVINQNKTKVLEEADCNSDISHTQLATEDIPDDLPHQNTHKQLPESQDVVADTDARVVEEIKEEVEKELCDRESNEWVESTMFVTGCRKEEQLAKVCHVMLVIRVVYISIWYSR